MTAMLIAIAAAAMLTPASGMSKHEQGGPSVLVASVPVDEQSPSSLAAENINHHGKGKKSGKVVGKNGNVYVKLTYKDGTDVGEHIQKNTGSRHTVNRGKSAIKATFR